jgi:hypothetical protein
MAEEVGDQSPPKEITYLKWSSPSRLFKKRDKEFITNIAVIVFFLMVILVFAREFGLIAAVLSIVFFIYVMSTVPPENIEHRLTNFGLESGSQYYRWETLVEFWFEEQWGQVKLVIRPAVGTLIYALLGDQPKDKIKDIVAKQIPYREHPQKSWVDNAAHWISEKVPLEKPAS